MDPELVRLVREDVPKLNPRLANGFATEQLKYAEQYISDILRSAAKGFPEGLQYVDLVKCTPEEEYAYITKKKNPRMSAKKATRKTYETSRSDVYLVKLLFRYFGEDLPPCYVYLPFVGPAGGITISGSKFNIAPVLADRVISVGPESIFVRVSRDRLIFYRESTSFVANGERQYLKIVHSQIHKGYEKQRFKKTVTAFTTMVHYLMCKYGFFETFKKYANCTPVVGEYEINDTNYPTDQWVICASNGIAPTGRSKLNGLKNWNPPKLRIAIRKEEWTPFVRSLVGGIFYVADHLPELIVAKYIDYTRQWMIAMGHIIYSGNVPVGKLVESILNHIASLDEYIDNITRKKMHDINVDVENIHDFFALIIENFNTWLLNESDKINSMYDKELSVNYYVLYDITEAIFHFNYAVNAAAKKGLKPEDGKKVTEILKNTIKTGLIFRLNHKHGEISTNSYSGDNKVFKITSTLIPQSGSTKSSGKKGDRGGIGDASRKIHPSVAEVGAYSGMRKSDPTGHSQLNVDAHIDHKGVIVRNPLLIESLDEVQAMIRPV